LNVYFKDQKTFKTTEKAIPQNWSIPLLASEYEVGSVTIPQINKKNYAGNWIYISDHLLIVDESTPQNGVVELKVSDPINIFSRDLVYPSNPASTYGEFIKNAIDDNFVNCPDEEYRLSYILVTNEDATPFEEPDMSRTNIYSLIDIVNTGRKKGVVLDFSVDGSLLKIHIHTNSMPIHNVIFSDGHADLDTESFNRVKVAKISVMKATATDGQYDESTWYLSKTGEISETVPAERAEGTWVYLSLNKDDDVEQKVRDKFNENIDSHKIEFYSDRVYNLWDSIKVKVDGELLTTHIVGIYINSDNNRYLYKCGELATTLTDKVKKEEKKQEVIYQQVEKQEEEGSSLKKIVTKVVDVLHDYGLWPDGN